MRRQFTRPSCKRKPRPLTGRKAAQRHAAWRMRKAGLWPRWVRPLANSVYAADSEGPLS